MALALHLSMGIPWVADFRDEWACNTPPISPNNRVGELFRRMTFNRPAFVTQAFVWALAIGVAGRLRLLRLAERAAHGCATKFQIGWVNTSRNSGRVYGPRPVSYTHLTLPTKA